MSAGARERIVLIGLRGAGKSAVGRRLAEALGWSFVDTDAWVEERLQESIPSLFAAGAESRFRRAEEEALRVALGAAPVVIATGGGLIERKANRALLKGIYTVWLQAPAEVLAERCRGSDRPPLLAEPATASGSASRAPLGASGESGVQETRVMLRRRRRHYASCATLSLATARLSIDEVCERLERAWRDLVF